MHISLVEPFFSGSHQQWAEAYQQHSRHQITLYTLPGRHWKWRMHGGAVSLAQQFLAADETTDMVLATDMLDLTTFLALIKSKIASTPTVLYFHENQLTYPWSPTDTDVALQRDNHYAFINYTSALAADQIYFNSQWHLDSFMKQLPTFLAQFPDFQNTDSIESIRAKAQVLYLGMDLHDSQIQPAPHSHNIPIILWNHRWEYDKNPKVFFECMLRLDAEGIDFKLIVLGKSYQKVPSVFAKAKHALASRIIHWGYTDTKDTYTQLLSMADILPVTSLQDFFGGSVVEAIYQGCYPLLPARLAYPEHLPIELHIEHLYHSDEELYQKLRSFVVNFKKPMRSKRLQNFVARYDWSNLAPHYDTLLEKLTML